MNGAYAITFQIWMDFGLPFQLGYIYDLFHLSNKLIFHDVFVFFTTLYIHLVEHVTKTVTL
jgi:hypothetical protein